MLDLNPYLLRAFLTVAEVGTVNGAATALNRTQAAVSMQVRKLEGLVGADLFERSSKGLTLTSNGMLLVAYAREILALNAEVDKRFRGTPAGGRVQLGVVEEFAATWLVDILRAYHAQNPRLEIDIIVEPNKRLAAMFGNDRLDVAICDTRALPRGPMLTWSEQLFWTASADLEIAPDAPLPIILFEEACHWRGPALAALSAREVQWRLAGEASTLIAMASAIRIGLGIGPMTRETIPADCREIGERPCLPGPFRIEMGLYKLVGATRDARLLADFIARILEKRSVPLPTAQAVLAMEPAPRPWIAAPSETWPRPHG